MLLILLLSEATEPVWLILSLHLSGLFILVFALVFTWYGVQFVQLDQQPHRQDLLAEVPLVQRPAEDRLVQPLELGQGELPRQQLEPDRLVVSKGTCTNKEGTG